MTSTCHISTYLGQERLLDKTMTWTWVAQRGDGRYLIVSMQFLGCITTGTCDVGNCRRIADSLAPDRSGKITWTPGTRPTMRHYLYFKLHKGPRSVAVGLSRSQNLDPLPTPAVWGLYTDCRVFREFRFTCAQPLGQY